MNDLKPIVESLLFVAEEPLSINRILKIIPNAGSDSIRDAIAQLREEYEQRQGGFFLREVAGGFQFCTRPEYNHWIKRFIQPKTPRLSSAALETLAIIAYKQPVIRSDIEHIRGVDCGGVLRALLERKLVRVMGRKEIPGRPLIYGTTRQFLEVFDLKNLKDLPTLKEIEALGGRLASADQTSSEHHDDQTQVELDLQADPTGAPDEPEPPEPSETDPESGDQSSKIGKNT